MACLKKRLSAEKIEMGPDGMRFQVRTDTACLRSKSPPRRLFQVYNLLAAICPCLDEGIDTEVIDGPLADCKGAPGRLEAVETGRGFQVFIDYAHTDDALLNVLKTLKKVGKKRLVLVFGCGGEQGPFQEARMGNVASAYADRVVDNVR